MKKSTRFIAAAASAALCITSLAGCGSSSGKSDTIKIGGVFSLTGVTAITEESMTNCAQLAVDQINDAGGVNGKKLEYIVKDYASDADTAVKVTRELIMQDEVSAIVGPYMSSARVAMEPVVEEKDIPLIYPTYYEGETPNDHVIYTGAVPNQQGDYFVPWLYENVSKNFYLIGTDTTYASAINKQAEAAVTKLGGNVVGNELVPSDTTQFTDIISKIQNTCGDDGCVIYANLNGDSGTAFYTQFAAAGLSDKYTIASFIMDESFSTALGDAAVGTYASANYFNSISSDKNTEFLKAYSDKYGAEKAKAVTAVGEATYDAVQMLAESLEKCGDDISTESILSNFSGLTYDAPQGEIKEDPDTHHIYLKARIGQVQKDGSIKVVYESDDTIKPVPVE
ncbi:MAG: transporter substrate-binding protein [Lachnospiraceae bacterium]|nr:transporter substrate-binding protein [Lachnospiraceae bacterium]